MSNPIEIKINADTKLLSLKLHAIAKHAESLAKELDKIDDKEECGSIHNLTVNLDSTKIYNDMCLKGLGL